MVYGPGRVTYIEVVERELAGAGWGCRRFRHVRGSRRAQVRINTLLDSMVEIRVFFGTS